MRTRSLLLLFGLFFVVASAQKVEAQLIPVTTCGQTLAVAGEYILMNDLNCSSPTGDIVGVRITASDVVFHLAGRTISSSVCDDSREVIGILSSGGLTNVRIDGGGVSGFNDGVLIGSSNSVVNAMKVTGVCFFGIHVQGNDNRIEKNTATGNGDGLLILNADRTHARSNNLSGNSRAGVTISGTDPLDNIVEDNIINNNGAASGYGVVILSGSGNHIRGNSVNNNRSGIYVDSPGNRVLNNTASGNADVGIAVTLDGMPTVVRRNRAFGNAFADMSDGNILCGTNLWRVNAFQTDLVAGVPNGGPTIGCIR